MAHVDNLAKYTNKISFKDKRQLSDEVYEVQQYNMTVKEKYPLHCGNTVLQLSKLIMMKFVVFLDEYLTPGMFELIYSGNKI